MCMHLNWYSTQWLNGTFSLLYTLAQRLSLVFFCCSCKCCTISFLTCFVFLEKVSPISLPVPIPPKIPVPVAQFYPFVYHSNTVIFTRIKCKLKSVYLFFSSDWSRNRYRISNHTKQRWKRWKMVQDWNSYQEGQGGGGDVDRLINLISANVQKIDQNGPFFCLW